jgi:MauM/NapG family ferredoxin protein
MSDEKKPGVSRRDLFTFWRREAPAEPAPAPAPPPALPAYDPLRPPGAIAEDLFVDRCTRCGKCVAVCPRQAITPLDPSFGRATGTPGITARHAPCVVCEGLQCTQVCPSGALLRVAVFDVQMGTAILDEERCVTFHGESCRACVDACPVPGALVADEDGHPRVEPARCIGCGVCENVCPTETASIVVEPARELVR